MRATLFSVLVIVAGALACHAAEEDGYRWVASWERGKPADNLELFFSGDGLTEEIEEEGRQCIRTRGLYIYFKVVDAFAYEIDVDMTLEVEYLDEQVGPAKVQYDAMTSKGRASYRDSHEVQMAGSRRWTKAVFRLPGAWLANGENQGADFRIALFGANPPIHRVRLLVDDLQNETYASPEDRTQALRDLKLRQETARISEIVSSWTARERQLQDFVADLPGESRGLVQPILDAAGEAMERMIRATATPQKFGDDQSLRRYIADLRRDAELAVNCTDLLERKVQMLGFVREYGKGIHDWLYFARPAVDNFVVVLPWTLPAPPEVNAPVHLRLCRGEFEPHTLGLLSRILARDVQLTPTDFYGLAGGRIPAESLDIRVTKRWYQAGRLNETQTGRELVPELLLYDDSLLKADLTRQKNVLNFEGTPADAGTLQPFDLEPLHTKLLWLTMHAPEETPAGDFRGTIKITARNLPDLRVPVRIEVLPFTLEENPKIASMYYSDHVPAAPGPAREKYKRRLINMRRHGLTDPACGGQREELALRQQLGLNRGPLLMHGGFNIHKYMGRDNYTDTEKKELQATVDKYNSLASEFGYDGAYLYAIDEASGETLAAEVPVFRLLEELGGGAWAAVLSDYEEVAAEALQMPNYSGLPRKELVEKVHRAGHRMMRYGSPQGGTEDPWQWRYRFGLLLWELNLDGGCTWAYRGATGNPWDDFDGVGTYRDFMMTYPGADGPIDTVQWEGYREGCDDLRYMATLEKVLTAAKAKNTRPELVLEIDTWLAHRQGAPFTGDNPEALREWCRAHNVQAFNGDNLDAVRAKIIDYILALGSVGRE